MDSRSAKSLDHPKVLFATSLCEALQKGFLLGRQKLLYFFAFALKTLYFALTLRDRGREQIILLAIFIQRGETIQADKQH